jgi:hypothetical protein
MTARTWAPIPAWWIPVWVVLDGASGALDPLEDAVLALVAAGKRQPDAVASVLAVPTLLVERALAHLAAQGLVAGEAGAWRPVAAAMAGAAPQERAAFVAWDEATIRPLLQVWLDPEAPEDPPDIASATVLPVPSADREWPKRPSDQRIDRALQLFAATGAVVALEPIGSGVREVDGARVVRVRRRLDQRFARRWIWAPVEHRLHGAIVWRPSLVPRPNLETELDPGGWEGLVQRVPELAGVLQAAQGEVLDAIAPGVLERAGFRTVDELRAEAHRSAERALDGPVAAPWQPIVALVAQAYAAERTAEAVGLDWRALARGWADVLEALTLALLGRVRIVVLGATLRAPQPEEVARLVRELGPGVHRLKAVWRNPEEAKRLADTVRDGTDSIGTRLLAVMVAVASDAKLRSAFLEAMQDHPRFFDDLDTANKERIAVVHRRDATDEQVSVVAFRERVIALARTSVRLAEL